MSVRKYLKVGRQQRRLMTKSHVSGCFAHFASSCNTSLILRVSHLPAPRSVLEKEEGVGGGGGMRDPANEVASV